ncbi:GNAT family N-acetyltransferase [Ktedonosporobacter rubrisoli]|nr:GNAT family N-acetyltransferase [Ktedonosporobacter rubrisoli]
MLELQFRLATLTDLEQLLDFIQQFYAIDHYAFDEAILRKSLGDLLTDPSLGRVWLIYDGTAAIGYAVVTLGYSLEFHGRNAFLDELFFVEAYRGKGLGTKTLQFLFAECQRLGIHALHLEVEHTNKAGQALYQKLGFKAHATRYLMTRWLEA